VQALLLGTQGATRRAGMGAIHRSVSTARHDAVVAAASEWAAADERVRALVLKLCLGTRPDLCPNPRETSPIERKSTTSESLHLQE
jgi:hypothetical protein